MDDGRRRTDRVAVVGALVAVAVAVVLNVVGVFSEEEIHWRNFALGLAIIAVAAAIVYGLLVRRWARRPERVAGRALVLSGLGLVTVVAFWSGLPPVFGVAGALLRYEAMRAAPTHGRRVVAATAVVVGVTAVVLDAGAFAVDAANGA